MYIETSMSRFSLSIHQVHFQDDVDGKENVDPEHSSNFKRHVSYFIRIFSQIFSFWFKKKKKKKIICYIGKQVLDLWLCNNNGWQEFVSG